MFYQYYIMTGHLDGQIAKAYSTVPYTYQMPGSPRWDKSASRPPFIPAIHIEHLLSYLYAIKINNFVLEKGQ